MAIVFVTGAARGLGRAIAIRFATAGHAVALGGRSAESLQDVAEAVRRTDAPMVLLRCDVTDRASIADAFGEARERLGPIDVLINNAGVADSAAFVRMDDAMWDRSLAVNLTGTYLCMRAALPTMLQRRSGRIINIASVAGKTGFAYTAAYCASKHGVVGLTRAVALEVAGQGVTVNAICPGWLDTEMTQESIERIVRATGRPTGEARAAIEGMSPQHRLISPDEVAALALFLAGDDARGITGQALSIDGGELLA